MSNHDNGKWSIAFWVLTVLTVGGFSWTSWCFFTNQGRIERLAEVANHSMTGIRDSLVSIDKRLYRIELSHYEDNKK